MKHIYLAILAVGLLTASCDKDASEVKEEIGITKTVEAKVVNGETTVTVTTTENGETKTEVLTGEEAEAYIDTDHLEDIDAPEGAKVIVKKMDHSVDIDIDVDDILNDPELQDLDEETKAKIKKALEGAMEDMDVDVHVEHLGDENESTVKTKVVVIDESK